MPPEKKALKSDISLRSVRSSRTEGFEVADALPLDVLQLKIHGLLLREQNPPYYMIKVTFFDQILISTLIKPLGLKDQADKDRVFAVGTFNYDPSDYEKMCLFADCPLIVTVQPIKEYEENEHNNSPLMDTGAENSTQRISNEGDIGLPSIDETLIKETSCCNIDILPLFLDQDKICVKKRMQPMISPNILCRMSWDNLPLLTMSLAVERHEKNREHHRILHDANWMKVTVVGAYNMYNQFTNECLYTAATKIPMHNSEKVSLVTFNEGFQAKRRFKSTCFYPRWESLRLLGEPFTKSDDKFNCNLDHVFNPENLNLPYYMQSALKRYSSSWGSFHRSLMLGDTQKWIWKHLRRYKWPLEIHYYGESIGGCSFMGFMDLFPLLYPGASKLAIAVPLCWFNANVMLENCDCNILLMPQTQECPTWPDRPVNRNGDNSPKTGSDDTGYFHSTGADENSAFVLVEVQFSRPLIPEVLPKYIPKSQFMQMLADLEGDKGKNSCSGRGQRSQNDWQAIVRAACSALQLVPCQVLTNFCSIIRQLSETRTRVEILTSFIMEAAIYTNNNFVVQTYLQSDAMFEEMLMLAHVCMMRIVGETLIGSDDWYKMEPSLRAARHARQLHDVPHAVDLYLQAAVASPSDGDVWRELSTCLKDINKDWARVCLNKSLLMNIRHPLTLLSKACMVYEEEPTAAEPFFTALLTLYPFWPTGYIIYQAYCTTLEKFRLADAMGESPRILKEEQLSMELPMPRAWERELGDFWEPTLLLPGMDRFYDAADLLLRIRCISLAEICLSIALSRSGQTPAYYHLVALCYRLNGDFPKAICLAREGMEVCGQNTYLKCLEGECLHAMQDFDGSKAAYEKVLGASCAHSTLLSLPCWEASRIRTVLVDLLRRQPTAYGWMALADDWLTRNEKNEQNKTGQPLQPEEVSGAVVCAVVCAEQALKFDRRAGRAWALLAKLVRPKKRREFCRNMAIECGFKWAENTSVQEIKQQSQESLCHFIGVAIKECRCEMCEHLRF